MAHVRHPLEPLAADEVARAVAMLNSKGKVTPTTRFVSVSLKEPRKDLVHAFKGARRDPARGLRRAVRQRHQHGPRGERYR